MRTTMKCIDWLNKAVGVIVGLMLGVMSIFIIAQIVSRFVINMPLHWTEEAARYLMVYIVFLGAALAVRHNRMIAIEIIMENVKPKVRRVLKITTMVITIIFSVILLVEGMDILDIVHRQLSAGLGITMDIPYMAIPIGALLIIINSIAVIIELLTTDHEPESEVEEALRKGGQL